MNQSVFSQSEVMRFLSMGFNAMDELRFNNATYTTYYFYGYNQYSEAIIDGGVSLSIDEPGVFYPNGPRLEFTPNKYTRYTGKNNSIGYFWHVFIQGSTGMEYKFENGKLVYWARGKDYWGEGLEFKWDQYTILRKIEQNNQSITVYYTLSGNDKISSDRYYNISKTELLDIFLKRYTELINDINENLQEYIDNFRNDFEENILLLIKGRTSRELAIFRNCLYAIKGYKFANPAWTEFFNKYLDGYNGRYTNDEVTTMFTENEKWLLDLIIQHENRR
jgi:hypothetical protein